jgi:hypothetical protein
MRLAVAPGLALALGIGATTTMFRWPRRWAGASRARRCSWSARSAMIGTAFLASLVPALRALRIDPITALRGD